MPLAERGEPEYAIFMFGFGREQRVDSCKALSSLLVACRYFYPLLTNHYHRRFSYAVTGFDNSSRYWNARVADV